MLARAAPDIGRKRPAACFGLLRSTATKVCLRPKSSRIRRAPCIHEMMISLATLDSVVIDSRFAATMLGEFARARSVLTESKRAL